MVGKAGEDMLKRALASPTMTYLNWGDIVRYRDATLTQPSDGLVIAREGVQGYSTTDLIALVEVKNRREWPYPENYMLWKLIRNAYLFDVVGIYFSRRIPRTTFWYAFKSIGAVGVETFNQLAPPDSEAAFARVRHKYGLGYHDLYFREDVPPYLQRQVDALPPRIIAARDRMNDVRGIVEDYLNELADKQVVDLRRRAVFNELHHRLKEHDREVAAEEERVEADEFEDDTRREFEDEMRRNYEDEIDRDW